MFLPGFVDKRGRRGRKLLDPGGFTTLAAPLAIEMVGRCLIKWAMLPTDDFDLHVAINVLDF